MDNYAERITRELAKDAEELFPNNPYL
jgi:hypothetical protein